jgi:hypothetical protein
MFLNQKLQADLLRVAKVMGYEQEFGVTDDIRTANAMLVTHSELTHAPSTRGVARFHRIPIYVVKVVSIDQNIRLLLSKNCNFSCRLSWANIASVETQLITNDVNNNCKE